MPGKTAAPAKPVTVVAVSQDKLKEIARFVLRESATGEVRSVISIGRYLFAQLFRGSEAALRSKDRTKADSLNDLAAQPGMAEASWSRSRLRNAIEIALMARAHRDFRAWRFLRVSHYEEVIGLPAEKQRALLDRAEQEGWSVARLKQEPGQQKPRAAKAAPLPTSPEKALGQVRKARAGVTALTDPLAASLVGAGVEADDAEELAAAVQKVVGLLDAFQKQLEGMRRKAAGKLKRVAGKVAGPG